MSAMSLAISIEPMKVMYTSASESVRRLPATATILRARIVKNLMLRSAATTASVRNRQERVRRSK